MDTAILAAAGAGSVLFLYSYVKMGQAVRQTSGRIHKALVYLFLTSITYLFAAGGATVLDGLERPVTHPFWSAVPLFAILTGLLWAKSASDWPVLVRHATIMEEVGRKVGGDT